MSDNIIAFSQTLAQEYISSNDPFPVDFDDAWQWLDYARKDTAKRAFDKCGFTENLDYQSFRQTVEREIGATVKEVIKLSVECFKTWAMMAGTEKGKQVRRYFLECEKIAKSKAIAVFDIPKTFGEALLLAGKLEQEKEILEIQNKLLEDENHHLSEAVDELFDYSSIIRIAKFNNMSETCFKWQRLKAVSIKMGLEIKKVPCPRFQWKNLYSHDAWRVAYPGVKLPETTTLVIKSA
jgi:phage anti-repressor protein